MATAEEMREVRALIGQLRGKDKAARLAATRQMTRISIVLGPERCRNELIPYVVEGVTEVEDDEEILLAVADALGEPALFAALGDQALVKMLISALEPFLAFDNPNVRDRAVASIKKVLAALPPRDVQGDGVNLIRHLAASEFFGPRVAAPPLLVELYASLSKGGARESDGLRRELRFSFCALCADDSPVVRKSAASALSQLLPLLELSEIEGEVYPVFQKICQDPQDSVRISSVESILALLRINNETTNSQAMSHLFELSQDKSWRVRYMVAERYGQLLDAIPNAGTRKTFVPCLIKLLQDEEAEVRTAAAFQVASTCKSNPDLAVVASVLDCVIQLVEDPNQHVRAALASVVLDLAPSLGRERTIKDLLPHFLLLLRDDFHEVAAAYCIVWRPLFPSQSHLLQVRMNIICKLDLINRVIGIDLLSETLLPAIFELSQDKSWRVRVSIIERMPLFAQQLGPSFFQERLSALCVSLLTDSVFAVRQAAVVNLSALCKALGPQWSLNHLLPKLLPVAKHESYLSRNVALDGIGKLAVSIGSEAAVISLAALQKGASDAVPNVRFNAIKALRFVAPLLPPHDVSSIVLPIMRNLATADSDVDVQFFAADALAALS